MNHHSIKNCPNCGHSVSGMKYCPNCGQKNVSKKLSLSQLIKDFSSDYFTFDSKFFHSLIPLMFKPGFLTREYVEGRRSTYILPLRLYIFTTFIFFLVVAISSKMSEEIEPPHLQFNSTVEDSILNTFEKHGYQFPDTIRQELFGKKDSVAQDKDGVKIEYDHFNFRFSNTDSSDNRFLKYINKKSHYLNSLGKEGANRFVQELVKQVPKILFILLPLFALFLKLVYFRQKILYIEHLIFSLHFHTFLFLDFLFIVIMPFMVLEIILFFMIFVYLLVAIKNYYRQGWLLSLLKFITILILYTISILPAVILLLFIAVVTV